MLSPYYYSYHAALKKTKQELAVISVSLLNVIVSIMNHELLNLNNPRIVIKKKDIQIKAEFLDICGSLASNRVFTSAQLDKISSRNILFLKQDDK